MKRILIFALAAALVFAGCGQKETPKTTETESVIEEEVLEDTEEVEEEPDVFAANEISDEELEEMLEKMPEEEAPPLNIPAWTTDRVNFRNGPDTSSEVITKLPGRSEVLILHELTGWYEVSCEDQTGFISADYITTEEPTGNGMIICIDPGHQRSGDSTPEPNGPGSSEQKARVTSGTTGRTTGVAEYQLNLDISLKLRDELQARGYTVVMTRETHDINISNMERAQFATAQGADITVRIHANGNDSSSVSGALTMAPSSSNPYVAGIADASQRLSRLIIDSYCAATGMNNQGVMITDTMTGINWCTMPVTIVEMGYMTNPTDDTNMQDPGFQSRMVSGIADGIDEYFYR